MLFDRVTNYLPVDCQQQQDYLKEAEPVLLLLYLLAGVTVFHLLLDRKSILLSSCIIVTVMSWNVATCDCVHEVKSACESSGPSCWPALLSGFCSMKHLHVGVFQLPLDRMPVYNSWGLPPAVKFASTHKLYKLRHCERTVSCPVRSQCPLPGLKSGLLDLWACCNYMYVVSLRKFLTCMIN